VVIRGGRDARYIPTGHLLYAVQRTLLAVPFDLGVMEVTGASVPVVEGVARSVAARTAAAHFSVSNDGTLVYVSDGGNTQAAQRILTWVDRQGREEPLKAPPRPYGYVRLSPDGERAAVDIADEEADIWIWHIGRETLTRLTLEPSQETYPVWTADGQRVIFNSDRAGLLNLFWQPADGTGTVERLIESQNQHSAMSVPPDGGALVVREQPPGGGDFDLMLLSLKGERRLAPLVQTPFPELNGEISPDGRWLVYQSTESGGAEIYVRPFPNVDGGRWQVSTDGGTRPLWARSGRELFYLTPEGAALMSVPILGGSSFKAGNPQKVLDTRLYYAPPAPSGIGLVPGRTYDVSPDGRRFLLIKPLMPTDSDATPTPPSLTVVQGWTQELRRLVPTN
jgi:serine/threonine-protein kinase